MFDNLWDVCRECLFHVNFFPCSILLLRRASADVTEDLKVWHLQVIKCALLNLKSRDGNLVDLFARLVRYCSDESRATLSAQQGSTEYPVSVNTAYVEPFDPIIGAQYFALGEVETAEGKKNECLPMFYFFLRTLLTTALLRLVPVSGQADDPSTQRCSDSAGQVSRIRYLFLWLLTLFESCECSMKTWRSWRDKQEGKGAVRWPCWGQADRWTLPPPCGRAPAVQTSASGLWAPAWAVNEQPALTGCSCLAGAGVTVRARVLNCVDGVNVALLQKAVTVQRSFFSQRQSEGHRATEDV